MEMVLIGATFGMTIAILYHVLKAKSILLDMAEGEEVK